VKIMTMRSSRSLRSSRRGAALVGLVISVSVGFGLGAFSPCDPNESGPAVAGPLVSPVACIEPRYAFLYQEA
jgi:hypothetical protein